MKDLPKGVLFEINGNYVTNEGTAKNPSYHVWLKGVTHSVCDSAYSYLELAIARCEYVYNQLKINN